MNWVAYLVAARGLIFEEKSVWHQNCCSGLLQLGACFCEFLLLKWEIQSNSTGILLTKGSLGYHTSHEIQLSLCNSKANRRRKGWVKCIYWPATSTWLTKGQSSTGEQKQRCKLVWISAERDLSDTEIWICPSWIMSHRCIISVTWYPERKCSVVGEWELCHSLHLASCCTGNDNTKPLLAPLFF